MFRDQDQASFNVMSSSVRKEIHFLHAFRKYLVIVLNT